MDKSVTSFPYCDCLLVAFNDTELNLEQSTNIPIPII